MIVIIGTLTVDESQTEAFTALVRPLVEATLAEDGCVSYSFAEDVLRPGTFRIAEEWRDAESLAAHGRTDHYRTFGRSLRELTVTGMSVMQYEAGDGTKLA